MRVSFFIFIIFVFSIEAKAFTIDNGTCSDSRIYRAEIDNSTKQVYFWKTFLVDGHIARRSEFTYGFSFGSKLDCVKERTKKQDYDVQLIAARYANDPNARFISFWQVTDKEFCEMSSELFIEYCDPGNQNDSSDVSTVASLDELSIENEFTVENETSNSDLETKLRQLKDLLNANLISLDDYNKKKNELLNSITDSEKTIDTTAPTIEIDDYITITQMDYQLEGRVSDENSVFVEIDGDAVSVNSDNTFIIEGSAPVGFQKRNIVAFDTRGNKTSINIIIERIIDTSNANVLEKLNPKKLNSKQDKDRVALIIGIEKYENISDANFAKSDAQMFIDYAQGAFGVPQHNIKYFFDESAAEKSKFKIKNWLKKNINDSTEVYVYFSGHGMALNDGEELYLLTHDTIVEYIDETALNRNEIFNDIAQYNPKSVTAFLDTCYSGAGRADGEMLLAMAKGLVVVDEHQQKLPDNFTLFTAASAQESAWSLPEAEHGTFSYFLMKGMEGNADLNGDKKLTNGELRDYLLDNVGRYAQQQQTPQMVGDPNEVLMRF